MFNNRDGEKGLTVFCQHRILQDVLGHLTEDTRSRRVYKTEGEIVDHQKLMNLLRII